MKRFRDFEPNLKTAREALPMADAPCLPESIPGWIDEIPFREIRDADQACREFAATGIWPKMNNEVAAQCHIRIEQAQEFCQAMKDEPIRKAIADQTLEFLLVELWHQSAHVWASGKYGKSQSR